jgi:pimeloyl-ACP methyl ester carboxylesterase
MRRGKLVVLPLAGILLAATVPAGTATAATPAGSTSADGGCSCAAPATSPAGGRLVVATESGHDIQHEQPELVLDAA